MNQWYNLYISNLVGLYKFFFLKLFNCFGNGFNRSNFNCIRKEIRVLKKNRFFLLSKVNILECREINQFFVFYFLINLLKYLFYVFKRLIDKEFYGY